MRVWWPVLVLLATAACAQVGQIPLDLTWQNFDANKDGKLDDADIEVLLGEQRVMPTVDVNGDKTRDYQDTLCLLVLVSVWDRNADGVVSDEDSGPPLDIALPDADMAAASAVVSRAYAAALPKVPPDQEAKLGQTWPEFNAPDLNVRATMYERAGLAALALGNLDVAQWAFCRGCQIAPRRDSLLANVAFTLEQSGQYADALTLLAVARDIEPKAAATLGNIGWVFARAGRSEQARDYYAAAVQARPEIAQYHLNLGVAWLRLGDQQAARIEIEEALRLNPVDSQAVLLWAATRPGKPADDLSDLQKEYEEYCDEYDRQRQESGASEEDMPPMDKWGDMEPRYIVQTILEQLERRHGKLAEERKKGIEDAARKQIQALIDAMKPKGNRATEDWKLWADNAPLAVRKLDNIQKNAEIGVGKVWADASHRQGAEVLSYGPVFLQLATAQYAADRVGSLAQYIRDYYTGPMNQGMALVKVRMSLANADLDPEHETAVQLVGLTPLLILDMGRHNEEYYRGFQGERPAFSMPDYGGGNKLGISLLIVAFEWDLDTNEIRIQAGQGVIVAGTWSPSSGFGFEVGVGVDITEGPLQFEMAEYIKFGSDGSVTAEGEWGLGARAGPASAGYSASMDVPVRAASHEPIGAL